MIYRRKRRYGPIIVVFDREQVDGHWMVEFYVAVRGRGFYIGWADAHRQN